jgi:site-specific DNA-adenine methylase
MTQTDTRTPTALFPYPGSKRHSRYHGLIQPQEGATVICEPFAGSAATSLRFPQMAAVWGESNPAIRGLMRAIGDPDLIENAARGYVWAAYNHRVDGVEGWRRILETSRGGAYYTGIYHYIQRSCFGNVVRESSRGYNVSPSPDKFPSAQGFDLYGHLDRLEAAKPYKVLPDWSTAIAETPPVYTAYVLLDPPYYQVDGCRKMTACYPGHDPRTALELATRSLEQALASGFGRVQLTNYQSAELDAIAAAAATRHSYTLCVYEVGQACRSLGNSNGRLVDGHRATKGRYPTEAVYTFDLY